MKKLLSLIFILFVILGQKAFAQEPIAEYHPNKKYNEAIDLFEKEKYAAAHKLFSEFVDEQNNAQSELSVNAEYYAAISSLYLFHKDAEFILEKFVENHPESAWVKKIYFELGTYNYKRKKYKKALEWFEFIDPNSLSADQKAEFYYKRGHCYFLRDDYANAKHDFTQMLGQESDYKTPATYYFSHIAFDEGNYQTALDGFNQLKSDPNFAPVVPYYIVQINYKLGRYDELLSYAKPLIDSTQTFKVKRVPEISQLVGDALYRKNRFHEAIPYFETYLNKTPKIKRTPEDYYQLGYSYYVSKDYENALEVFANCADDESEIGQSATYFMGDCYLKLDQKPYARTAFKSASEMDYKRDLKEDALFNYAKLAYELSYNPFHEAITAFEKYLEEYPDSPRTDEAYEFLLNVYMKSKNYQAALNSLDKIKNKDTRTKEAYQVVAFNRGVELYKTKKYDEANSFFDKVSTYNINQTINAEAIYWKAEIAFAQKNFPQALSLYHTFIHEPGAVNSGYFNEANYGAGYALFKQKKYVDATSSFRKFVDNKSDEDKKIINDAYIRLGDCYYVSKSFDKAIGYYEKAISLNESRKDYAMFQKAISYGKKDDLDQKISELQAMINDQAGSKYIADAKYELAKAFLEKDQLNEAKTYFKNVIDNHSNSPFRKYSQVKLILIAVKQNEDQTVLALWNKMNKEYPNDPILKEAYSVAQDVLIDNNITDIPENIAEQSEIEEKVYTNALDQALAGNCSAAIEKLTAYLNKYEPGMYALDANYYLGNCYFEQGEMEHALNAYNYVIAQPASQYTEESLVAAATINFNNKNYEQAKNNYIELEHLAQMENNELEAQIGLLRTHYLLGEFNEAQEYADKVIANDKTPTTIQTTAYLWRGKIFLKNKDYDRAYNDFAQVEKEVDSEEAAESKYHMAEIAYLKKAYKPAETEIFQLVEKYSSYDKWKFKGFLLLADVYIGMEDFFQARETLKVILANVSTPWVIDEANKKMELVDQLENEKNNPSEVEEEEIDLNGNSNTKTQDQSGNNEQNNNENTPQDGE